MFKKILIAEDHQSANISVRKTLEEIGIKPPMFVYHCDAALLQINNGLSEDEPYDLLITDLEFESDDIPQKLTGGEALIKAVRLVQPSLKILVFSSEKRAAVIDKFFEESLINGYVLKARRDAEELVQAITTIAENKRHYPSNLRQAIQHKNLHKFTKIDIRVVKLIYEGKAQKELPDLLEKEQLRPNSLRSIEQRLHIMRTAYTLSNNIQLVALCKEMGLI